MLRCVETTHRSTTVRWDVARQTAPALAMELPLVQRYAAAAAIAIHATHPRQTALVLTLELPMG
jgi:hypothetical protein